MSAISDYKHTIIPLAIAGVGTAVSGLFNIVVDSEIANAPMAKLVSLSKSYQKDMLFWKDVKTLAMGASIASALALGTFLSIGLTRTAPQIRERDWFLLYTGGFIALVTSLAQWKSAADRFTNYQYLYDRCIQRLKFDFNYIPS